MLRSSRNSYWLNSSFQKKPSEGSRLSSRLSNLSTKDHLRIDNSVNECRKNDIFYYFSTIRSKNHLSVDLAILLLGVLLVSLVDLVVCSCSWGLVHDLRLFHCCCGFLLNFLFHSGGFGCSFLVDLGTCGWNWLLEGTFLQLLKVFSLCDLDIRNHSVALRWCLCGILCLLFLLNNLTSINLKGNLHNKNFTLAVVKNFNKFSVTLSNWCNFL